MMKSDFRIPVEVRKIRDRQGREKFEAAAPMEIMFEKEFDDISLERELLKFERRYFCLIVILKNLYEIIENRKHGDIRVLLFWEFGNKIVNFLEENKRTPFYLKAVIRSLSRDVGVSGKIIIRSRKFRLLYPDVTVVETDRPFYSYVREIERA